MCGIAGFWQFGGGPGDELRATSEAMASCLRHRGPDDSGTWSDAGSGVSFGFRRLAILDLSPAGAQPMTSASGRYVIVFNGEVYNFERLRKRLEQERTAPPWRGHSDTEVLLACLDAWGLDATLPELIGMFAFAVWDAKERRLSLARDRAGEKPLYYGSTSDAFVFGSQLDSLASHPSFQRRIDSAAASHYTVFGYVPAPHAIYADARKLVPGSIVVVTPDRNIRETRYWDAEAAAERAASERFSGDGEQATDRLEELLSDSVMLSTASDVPLGVFLSGGIDSSVVTALMQRRSSSPVKTFTIGFDDAQFNEAPFAAEIARHLGTDHHETHVTADDALHLIPSVVAAFDEPFADSSAIPTYLVSTIAGRSVTVALGGDGGDELFGGYHRHFLGRRLQRRVGMVPRVLRPAAARALRILADSDRARHLARALAVSDPIATYYEDIARTQTSTASEAAIFRQPPPGLTDPTEGVMFLDFAGYLPDDILTKVDRAAMAVSLEVRAPFLDRRVIEFAWSLPLELKIRNDRGKWILKHLLARHLPARLIDREKKGFGIPVDDWLRAPLRDWAEDLLDPRRLRETGTFDGATVSDLWLRHRSGENHGPAIWTVLMFEAWRRRTGAGS